MALQIRHEFRARKGWAESIQWEQTSLKTPSLMVPHDMRLVVTLSQPDYVYRLLLTLKTLAAQTRYGG